MQKQIPGGRRTCSIAGKKTPSTQMETQRRGHEKNTREGNDSGNYGNPPFLGIPSFPGDRASRPREGTCRRPSLTEFGCGAPSFTGDTWAAVWHSCVAVARSPGVRWRSEDPARRGAYWNRIRLEHPMRHRDDDYR